MPAAELVCQEGAGEIGGRAHNRGEVGRSLYAGTAEHS